MPQLFFWWLNEVFEIPHCYCCSDRSCCGLVVWDYVSGPGFALNYVTAMIGAISIGVGIDYSIHMTQRFREELDRCEGQLEAIQRAAAGTGVAFGRFGGISIVGFAIMGFAPMPIFASFGQLTAVMIFLALLASLIVLPCLLVIVSRVNSKHGQFKE
ncbi:MAG: hypothetical protein CM1200mP3_03670 [Chloroflexota bacterium]|nr:MAG: hypothetical protein CM1200mP3_03670 [Chloroflexota bacterium]